MPELPAPPRRLRIAIVAEDVNRRGGQERVVAELCRSWGERHEVHLFCFTAEDVPEELMHVHRLWLPVHSLAFQCWWIILATRLLLRPRRFDVVLSQGGNCRVQNFVLAHTCHAARGWETLQARSEGRLSWLRRRLLIARNRWAIAMERKAVRRCAGRLIAISPALARQLSAAHGVPLDRIFVARNGVDQELFTPANREPWREPLRRELGLREDDFVLLFVGGLWREKGLLQTLQALAQMQHAAHLLVLGQGDEATFGQIAEGLGVRDRVHFLGRRPHVERYCAAADGFAFPSPVPWSNLATLEAAASGLPLVVARLDDTEEFFGEGRGAILIGPDPAEMAAALDRLAADPELRRDLGRRAREAVAPLRWDRQAAAIEGFLLQRLAGKALGRPPRMSPLRLAVISHSGVLEVNQALYAALIAAHPEVELLLIVPERWHTSLAGGRGFTAARSAPFVRALPVRLPGRLHQHWYGPALGRALRQFRPEVLLVHEEPYALVAAQAARLARRLGARLLLYTNQNILRRYPPPFSWIRARVLRQADRMLVLSEACAEVLRGAGYRGPVDYFPYPFALPEAPAEPADLAGQLGLERPLVGYVGRLEPQKGLLDLLEAAALLRQRGQSLSLLFVGDGPLRGEIERFAAERLAPGQLKLTGYIPHDQVAPYFQGLDVFVLASRTTPTWKEQFGRVLLEAWGYGVPVVGSDSGHIPLLIRETGGGLIFHEGDAQDLAAKLGELLAEPARARDLGRAAREVVRREYSLEAVAERLYEAVRKTAEEKPAG